MTYAAAAKVSRCAYNLEPLFLMEFIRSVVYWRINFTFSFGEKRLTTLSGFPTTAIPRDDMIWRRCTHRTGAFGCRISTSHSTGIGNLLLYVTSNLCVTAQKNIKFPAVFPSNRGLIAPTKQSQSLHLSTRIPTCICCTVGPALRTQYVHNKEIRPQHRVVQQPRSV